MNAHPTITVDLVRRLEGSLRTSEDRALTVSGARSTECEGCAYGGAACYTFPPTVRHSEATDVRSARCNDGVPIPPLMLMHASILRYHLHSPAYLMQPWSGLFRIKSTRSGALSKELPRSAGRCVPLKMHISFGSLITLCQLTVTFSEKKPKKSWFQVYVGEEDVPWEQWCV